ncbi:lipoyl amidotransferase LIPT1, mitochondrial [Denticeps clupeoides]|uniref:lipoyl amidotransferase LIPT1, mitochondrial n=1 Tax=Denticeps clupeoides TaxID=299321 RepID=UPI0010A408F3|nr:lipoyltransferase 1, mitochondrial [Denticeps clupeoides]
MLRRGALVRAVSCPSSHASTLSSLFRDRGESGVILKSSSTDVYENLAVEDRIHELVDLRGGGILFLWRSASAVVIGRHQNPWQECDLRLMARLGVPLARRRSGGGAVFHDLGNVNATFFTSRGKYDRRRNLAVLTGALKTLSPRLDVRATERFDVVLGGAHKVSGSAAKLGRSGAYHHCTLLCSADRAALASVLKSGVRGLRSNATPSVPSPVRNLTDEDPALDCDAVTEAVAAQYNAEFGFSGPVLPVDPGDEAFLPGVRQAAAELRAWDWVYGRTPRFSVRTSFGASGGSVTVDVVVRSGVVESCAADAPPGWLPPRVAEGFCSALVGSRFRPAEMAAALAAFRRTRPGDDEFAGRISDVYQHVVAGM